MIVTWRVASKRRRRTLGESPKLLAGKRRGYKMQFRKAKRVRSSVYPSALQLYKVPPTEVIKLEEFEELAEKRLKRMHIIILC